MNQIIPLLDAAIFLTPVLLGLGSLPFFVRHAWR
jgi:hypothetical protein